MDKKAIKELVQLADSLDSKGLTKEANELDQLVQDAAYWDPLQVRDILQERREDKEAREQEEHLKELDRQRDKKVAPVTVPAEATV